MEEITTESGKSGEKVWVRLTFLNGLKGLEINVKAVPELENFIKNLGSGAIHPVTSNHWYNPAEEKGWHGKVQKNEVWAMEHTIDNPYYSLHYVGERLIQGSQVNLSFLRLVGISDEGGITFGEAKPYSRSERVRIKGQISVAVREFVLDYLTPNRSVFNLVSDLDRVRAEGDQVIRPAQTSTGGARVTQPMPPPLPPRDNERDLVVGPITTRTIRNRDLEAAARGARINWTPMTAGDWDNGGTMPDAVATVRATEAFQLEPEIIRQGIVDQLFHGNNDDDDDAFFDIGDEPADTEMR